MSLGLSYSLSNGFKISRVVHLRGRYSNFFEGTRGLLRTKVKLSLTIPSAPSYSSGCLFDFVGKTTRIREEFITHISLNIRLTHFSKQRYLHGFHKYGVS